jgi:hypothetical protein
MVRRLMAIFVLGLAILVGTAGPASAAVTFNTFMVGSEERPGPGDPDGFGFATVTVIPEFDLICYRLVVFGIEPANAAHIHRAPRGEPGPVVVPLAAPTNGFSGGCVSDSDADAIAANPANYYVNVHNAPFPGGAVRGQLA